MRVQHFSDIFKQSRTSIINHKLWTNKTNDDFKVNLNDDLIKAKLFCEVESQSPSPKFCLCRQTYSYECNKTTKLVTLSFLNKPPTLASPGLPLEAPSVFSLIRPRGEGSHLTKTGEVHDPLNIELFTNKALMISFVYGRISSTWFEGKAKLLGKVTCFSITKKLYTYSKNYAPIMMPIRSPFTSEIWIQPLRHINEKNSPK